MQQPPPPSANIAFSKRKRFLRPWAVSGKAWKARTFFWARSWAYQRAGAWGPQRVPERRFSLFFSALGMAILLLSQRGLTKRAGKLMSGNPLAPA